MALPFLCSYLCQVVADFFADVTDQWTMLKKQRHTHPVSMFLADIEEVLILQRVSPAREPLKANPLCRDLRVAVHLSKGVMSSQLHHHTPC